MRQFDVSRCVREGLQFSVTGIWARVALAVSVCSVFATVLGYTYFAMDAAMVAVAQFGAAAHDKVFEKPESLIEIPFPQRALHVRSVAQGAALTACGAEGPWSMRSIGFTGWRGLSRGGLSSTLAAS